MLIFSKEFRKTMKKNIANNNYNTILNNINTKYSNDLICFIIKSLHFHCPFYFMLFMIICSFKISFFIYVLVILIATMFYYLYGCFLSLTELQLNNQDINVIDPFIMFFNDDITYKNRKILFQFNAKTHQFHK